MISTFGHTLRTSSSGMLDEPESKSESTISMSVWLIGVSAKAVDQLSASPAISIFISSNKSRNAERSSNIASARYTRTIHSAYHEYYAILSISWGVLFSATWGRWTFFHCFLVLCPLSVQVNERLRGAEAYYISDLHRFQRGFELGALIRHRRTVESEPGTLVDRYW